MVGVMGQVAKLLRLIGGFFPKLSGLLSGSRLGQWLWFTFFSYMGGLLGRLFTLLGVTLVVNKFLTPELTPLVADKLLSMPTVWINLLALTKIDQALTVLLSAIVIATADKVMVRKSQLGWQTPL